MLGAGIARPFFFDKIYGKIAQGDLQILSTMRRPAAQPLLWLLLACPTHALLPSPTLHLAASSIHRRAVVHTCANGIEKANTCTLLPADPVMATVVHVNDQTQIPPPLPDEVQLIITNTSLFVSVTPAGAALSTATRRLVGDLGDVRNICLHSPSAMRRLQLRRSYGDVPIEVVDQCDRQSSLSPTPPPTHRCDVIFARRGLRTKLVESSVALVRQASHMPLVGGCMCAATSALARGLLWQLTPTTRPTVTLRALKRMPWRCQRLGARAWLQAMLHLEETADVAEEATVTAARASRYTTHPMEIVHTLPMLSTAQCEEAIGEAEAYAASVGGWQTDRHVAYPTTDIPIRKLPRLAALWDATLFPAVAEAFRSRLGLPVGSVVTPLDVFVVKCDAYLPALQHCTLFPCHHDNLATMPPRCSGA